MFKCHDCGEAQTPANTCRERQARPSICDECWDMRGRIVRGEVCDLTSDDFRAIQRAMASGRGTAKRRIAAVLAKRVGYTFVLAPALVGEEAGAEYPGDPRAQCIFLVDGLCSIHDAKPFECRQAMHSDSSEAIDVRHREVRDAWKPYQADIVALLGREPVAASFFGFPSAWLW